MFYGLYKLLQIRKSLTDEACKTLVHALMTCHLDYCNAVMHVVSQYQQQRLQKVLNAAAWLIYHVPKYYHISLATDKISSYLMDHSASFQSSTWSSTLIFGKSDTSEAGRTLPPQKQR